MATEKEKEKDKAKPVVSGTKKEKYHEPKDLRKGEELFLYYKDKPVAYTTSLNRQINIGTDDVSSKMSGEWDSKLPGKISWSISTEAMVSISKEHFSLSSVEVIASRRLPVRISVCSVTMVVAEDGSKTFTKGAILYQGDAIITDLQDKSTSGERDTWSCTFTGTGPLLNGEGKALGTLTPLASRSSIASAGEDGESGFEMVSDSVSEIVPGSGTGTEVIPGVSSDSVPSGGSSGE